jgi:phosphoglycolate phosphatase
MPELRLVIFDVEGTLIDSPGAGPQTRPLAPGARAALDRLRADPFTLLGVATGTSRRRLDALTAAQGLAGIFDTMQVGDHHPSKPHPAMVLACLSETGVAARRAVMVGDTRSDMEMARAAGVRGIGIGWGHAAPEAMAADATIGAFAELDAAVDALIGHSTEQDA